MESGELSKDKYGFMVDTSILEDEEMFNRAYVKKVALQEERWSNFLEKCDDPSNIPKTSLVKKLARKGIPPRLRGQIWKGLAGTAKKRSLSRFSYEDLIQHSKSASNDSIKNIENDLSRTFPNHERFGEGKEIVESLRRVLVAYAVRNKKVGYCQSLNFCAALLLLFMDEEEAFWTLCCIVENLMPRDFYAAPLTQLHVDMKVLVDLLDDKLPRVSAHFKHLNVPLEPIFSAWFLCIYVNIFPLEAVLRIWDAFFFEGQKVLFRIAITFLMISEKAILACQDFSSLHTVLTDVPKRFVNCHVLLKSSFDKLRIGKFSMERINQYRAKHLPALLEELRILSEMRSKIRSDCEDDREPAEGFCPLGLRLVESETCSISDLPVSEDTVSLGAIDEDDLLPDPGEGSMGVSSDAGFARSRHTLCVSPTVANSQPLSPKSRLRFRNSGGKSSHTLTTRTVVVPRHRTWQPGVVQMAAHMQKKLESRVQYLDKEFGSRFFALSCYVDNGFADDSTKLTSVTCGLSEAQYMQRMESMDLNADNSSDEDDVDPAPLPDVPDVNAIGTVGLDEIAVLSGLP
eukprot:Rmarinus@m.27534